MTAGGCPGLSRMLQGPEGCPVSVGQRLSTTTFYPSWGTTLDKTLFVSSHGELDGNR
jgi:hypothetical protein